MKNSVSKAGLPELWKVLENKFCIDYKKDFSNKDLQGWLSHFAPFRKINIYQHGKDATGKEGEGKTIKIFTGNLFSSLVRGRMPAKLMGTAIFKRLVKQDYSHSEIELLGIQKNREDEHQAKVLIRFERFNKSGKRHESAKGLYSLIEIKKEWYINEISIYDEHDEAVSAVNFSEMWHPNN
jgi:hypothetical protein